MQALRPAARGYIAAVIILAGCSVVVSLLAALGVIDVSVLDIPATELFWRTIVVLAPVYVLAMWTPSAMSVPVAMAANGPVLFAAYLIAGPAAAAVVAACGLAAHTTVPWIKRGFNTAQFVLVGLGAGLVYVMLGGPLADEFSSGFGAKILVPVVASNITAVVINGLLLFGILRIAEGLSFRSMWRTVIVGSVVPYLGYGLFGLLMAVLWSVGGGFGAMLVLLPLLIARWAYRQYAEQQRAYEATIAAMVQAVETKDHYTRGHSERVSRAAVMIAHVRGMPADRVNALRYAGILHDVGKLGVPTRLLQKTGPLADGEYERIKMHPVHGTEMVRGITFLEEAYEGILHHHERLDGLGYPSGLQGMDIPEFARVIAVADAFDSMTSTRSYRGARSVEQALVELDRWRGTQFDPAMVDALVAALAREPWQAAAVDVESADGRDTPLTASFDHDDPGAPIPLGSDQALVDAADAAEDAQVSALRRQDDA
ncbi:MAG: HD-GYP domain-containing protein [Actinomycetes bacterium]